MSTRTATNYALRTEKGALQTVDAYDVVEEYGMYVFNRKTMREKLPKSTYKQFMSARDTGTPLTAELADQFATTLKEWALSLGATHYTHQFQPMTGRTAEKHDAFVETTGQGGVIMEFNGSLLEMGEPDASSFPSGGIRETHSARGYTAWDRNSYPYVRVSPNGGTLVIPTAFVSWTGEALDYKTPLLRSTDHLNKIGCKFLKLLGYSGFNRVFSTLGVEQEYFVVDRGYYISRPDLQSCGRTLIGNTPPRGQQLDDHYFGVIPPRVLAYMQECEQMLWRLGMPVKTRHNEVAPGQFESAPIFEEASVAADHNHLQMEIMSEVAQKHGLQYLIHEKPFATLNGSGKHHNWSLSSDTGVNFLQPGDNPLKNKLFLATVTACIRGVDVHADVLRASIANPGNDFRLGANEAPPAIMSVFLGSDLNEVIRSIIEGRALEPNTDLNINIGASSLPILTKDATDRNRTSPFAFTGNKFEFRAVGSAQSCAIPAASLNMIAADSLQFIYDEIDAKMTSGASLDDAFDEVIKTTLSNHYRVVFNGNGYSEEWLEEATKRGLPNHKSAPEAINQWTNEKNLKLFEPILSKSEMVARKNVWLEQYAQAVDIEAKTLLTMVDTEILPAALKYQTTVATAVSAVKTAINIVPAHQNNELNKLIDNIEHMIDANNQLRKTISGHAHCADLATHAAYMRDTVYPLIHKVRVHADYLETVVPNDLWPLPKYNEMLLLK